MSLPRGFEISLVESWGRRVVDINVDGARITLDKASTIFFANRTRVPHLVLRVFIFTYHTITNREDNEIGIALHHPILQGRFERTGSMFRCKRWAKPNFYAFHFVGLLRVLQSLCASYLVTNLCAFHLVDSHASYKLYVPLYFMANGCCVTESLSNELSLELCHVHETNVQPIYGCGIIHSLSRRPYY